MTVSTQTSKRKAHQKAYHADYHRKHYTFKHGYNTRYYRLAPFINGLQGADGLCLNTDEIACVAGVTVRTVYRWIEAGHLEAEKDGKYWKVML